MKVHQATHQPGSRDNSEREGEKSEGEADKSVCVCVCVRERERRGEEKRVVCKSWESRNSSSSVRTPAFVLSDENM